MSDRYTYRVTWSEEDDKYVGLCAEFHSLSWLGSTPEEGFSGIRKLVAEVLEDMGTTGETIPEPLAGRKFSGKFVMRVPPAVHRSLAIRAAEEGISVNRFAAARLEVESLFPATSDRKNILSRDPEEKTYVGFRVSDWAQVEVTIKANPYAAAVRKLLDPRLDLLRIAPSGFEWGYGGQGPSQLSLAILADATGDDHFARSRYQAFKRDVVGGLPREGWEIPVEEVVRWAEQHQG